jgi:hypothetical protein
MGFVLAVGKAVVKWSFLTVALDHVDSFPLGTPRP